MPWGRLRLGHHRRYEFAVSISPEQPDGCAWTVIRRRLDAVDRKPASARMANGRQFAG